MSFLCCNSLASKTFAERPSPHKLAVCVAIKLYTEPPRDFDDPDAAPFVAELSQVATQQLSRFLHTQIHATERAMESSSLGELQEALQDAVQGQSGYELSTCLQSYIKTACNSPDDLMDLLTDLDQNVLHPRSGACAAAERQTPGARVRRAGQK